MSIFDGYTFTGKEDSDMERSESKIIKINSREHDEAVLELQRLLACYQLATLDDKHIVWAVLNKYVKHITI